MSISRFVGSVTLPLGLALLLSIMMVGSAPAGAVAQHPSAHRHSGHILCRYTGQRCSSGCGAYADKGVCAEYVCDHRSWNFSGFCLKSECARKSCH